MKSVKSFWDKLEIGTQVKVFYEDKNGIQKGEGTIAAKNTNSIGRTEGFNGSKNRCDLIYMDKDQSKSWNEYKIKKSTKTTVNTGIIILYAIIA